MNAGSAAVVVVTDEFTSLAQAMAANAGRSGVRILSLPYPLESRTRVEVHAIATEYFEHLLDTLAAH